MLSGLAWSTATAGSCTVSASALRIWQRSCPLPGNLCAQQHLASAAACALFCCCVAGSKKVQGHRPWRACATEAAQIPATQPPCQMLECWSAPRTVAIKCTPGDNHWRLAAVACSGRKRPRPATSTNQCLPLWRQGLMPGQNLCTAIGPGAAGGSRALALLRRSYVGEATDDEELALGSPAGPAPARKGAPTTCSSLCSLHCDWLSSRPLDTLPGAKQLPLY